jgi:long-chain acyl-CoA synthetase
LFDALGEEGTVSEARPEPVSPESMAPEDQQLLSDPGAEQTWNYLAERFHDLRLTPDSSLAEELGIDSLSWVDLTLALQDRAGIDLDDSAIERAAGLRASCPSTPVRHRAGASPWPRPVWSVDTALANWKPF